MGEVFKETDFISCYDLNKKVLFYGIIKHMIIINILGMQLPFVEIQLLLDAKCFTLQHLQTKIRAKIKKKDTKGLKRITKS